MKFDTDIRYFEQYLPSPRHRKLREREIKSPFSVEVDEVSSKDAPIVLRTHNYERYTDGGITPVDYRKYGDSLYTPVLNFDLRTCVDEKEARDPFPPKKLGMYLSVRWGHLTMEEAQHEAKEKASPYLLIDGQLWKKTGEPMYEIATFGLGHNHASTDLMITNHFNPNVPWTRYFNALHQEEAIEAAVRIALGRGDTNSIESIKNKEYYIEVLDPRAVTRDPKAWGGKGDDFLNTLHALTSSADSAFEAGLLVTAFTGTEIDANAETKPSLDSRINSAKETQAAQSSKDQLTKIQQQTEHDR